MTNHRETFSEWAKALAGCDGGCDQPGGIWYSGIEWRGNPAAMTEDRLIAEITQPIDFQKKGLPANYAKLMTSRFSIKLLKLMCVIDGNALSDWKRVQSTELGNPFGKGSRSMVFNLFPLAFPGDGHHHWSEVHKSILGFRSKEEYLVWCRAERFPIMRSLVETHRPKAVIGIGSSYETDFVRAFLSDNAANLEVVSVLDIKSGRVPRKAKLFRSANGTMLFNIPFLGYPLPHDSQLLEIGEWIRLYARMEVSQACAG